jgi:hypothetical protein
MHFKKKAIRQALTDSDISGLVHMASQAGLKFVVSDRFYVVHKDKKHAMDNISELLRFIRGSK